MNVVIIAQNKIIARFLRSFINDNINVSVCERDGVSSMISSARTYYCMGTYEHIIVLFDRTEQTDYTVNSIDYFINHREIIVIDYDSIELNKIINKENLKDYVLNNLDEIKTHISIDKLIKHIGEENYKFEKTLDYTDHVKNDKISIIKNNLIKPENLYKHIGETLMFHNGDGYVVSAVLTKANIDKFDEYSFSRRYDVIDYEDELEMSLFYYPTDELSKFFTYEYAAMIKCNNIHKDEVMHNIKWIAVPTEEELKFRNDILSIDKDEIEKVYKELNEKYG